jgi:hypothetical protein
MIIGEIQLKIHSTVPQGGITLIGGQKEAGLTYFQNIIKETCEELFYHIPAAEHNIDPANGEPMKLVPGGGIVNNRLYTLGDAGIDRIYFYKISNAQGNAIINNALPHLDKSEILNLAFRNRGDITSQPIQTLLTNFGLG